jgi:hypothetical protein
MRIVRINEAEAIFEPFWTGDANVGSSRLVLAERQNGVVRLACEDVLVWEFDF